MAKPAPKKPVAPAKKAAAAKPETKKALAATPAKKAAPVVAKAGKETLYDLIAKATGVAADGMSHADYAAAAADAISKLDDNAYAKLPKKVTGWFDDAVDPINAGEPDKIPAIDGFPESTTAAAPAKKAAAAKPAKADKKAKEPGDSRGARTDSVAFKVRQVVVVNGPDMSFEDACKKAGIGAQERGSNAWNAYFNAVQVLRIARDEKLYKVKVVAD